MQIEIERGDYEVLPPKEPRFFKKILERVLFFSDQYGGWHSIFALCIGFYVLINWFFPEPGPSIQIITETVRYVIPPDEGGKITLFGSNFHLMIQHFGSYWRWITAIFLHFGLIHLSFNLLGGSILGSFLQKFWNARIVFLIFFLSGIGGNIGTFFIMQTNSAGASGGIFGLMGALLAFFLWNRQLAPRVRSYMLWQLFLILFLNLFLGVMVHNIDLVGHMTGLLTGFGLGRVLISAQSLHRKTGFWTGAWIISGIIIVVSFVLGAFSYFRLVYF